MKDLATFAMDAHGGLDRWSQLTRVHAHLVNGGALWALKGHHDALTRIDVTADLRRQWASHSPFGHPARRTSFEPDRVAIETESGDVIEERRNPRDSFHGHVLATPWDDLQLAYFAGYAMWTYLNAPFLFARPDVTTTEIEPWQENGDTWRRLGVTFPPSLATHSARQVCYFDGNGLLRRHDYDVDVAGGIPAAQYVSGHRPFDGITVPTKRTVYRRQPDGRPVAEPLVVSIEVDGVVFQ